MRKLFARVYTSCGLLLFAAVVALTLSAIQILPSLEFARHSTRRAPAMADRFFATIEPDTHSEHTYDFSVGPWRLVEYVWPNVGGRQFPVHRRWFNAIPAEGRIWTPSLYMGILPLLLALSAMRWWRGAARVRWLTWSVTLAAIASLGYFGLGWLMLEMRLESGLGGSFGGFYWLMTLLLPGYAAFRYPAKLLVVAALGLSVLAARGCDEAFEQSPVRVGRLLLGVGGLSLIAATAALGVWPFWDGWLAGTVPDMLLGPLDTTGAFRDLLGAFLQTALFCGVFWWLLRKGQPSLSSSAAWAPVAVVILVAVDLAVANRWMVACVPESRWEERSQVAQAIRAYGNGRARRGPAREETTALPPRVYRHPIWMPPEWEQRGSTDRLAEAVRWDRNTLWPKYNLDERISAVRVGGTMMLADYDQFLRTGVRNAKLPPGANSLDVRRLTEYAILPEWKTLPGGKRVDIDVEDVSLWHNPKHVPRAWIAHSKVGQVCNLSTTSRTTHKDRLQTCPTTAESCRLVHFDPLRVEIEAELAAPGTVVLCEQYYPGWTLDVTTGEQIRRLPIHRVNGVMRGVVLSPGHHTLVYRYQPASFVCGAVLSALGWTVLLMCAATSWFFHRRRRVGG